eukprot:4814658-Pyramimonas_sp.AAC.1
MNKSVEHQRSIHPWEKLQNSTRVSPQSRLPIPKDMGTNELVEHPWTTAPGETQTRRLLHRGRGALSGLNANTFEAEWLNGSQCVDGNVGWGEYACRRLSLRVSGV